MPELKSSNLTQKNTSNVFSKIKSWFKAKWPKVRIKIDAIAKKLWKFLIFCIKFLSKALAGAVIFAFMAELAPNLREQLPQFYEFIDMVLECLEFISAKALESIHQFF